MYSYVIANETIVTVLGLQIVVHYKRPTMQGTK